VTNPRANPKAEGLVPYPPIAQLGVISDRRTAAVVGTDGTVHWLCLPDYDGAPIFGCLLDAGRGGYWRLAPESVGAGRQSYLADSNVLVTRWAGADGEVELTDAMLFPAGTRRPAEEGRRRVLRRLRCRRGSTRCTMELAPRYDFGTGPHISPLPGGVELGLAKHSLGLWTSHPVRRRQDRVCASFRLAAGEEFWAILGLGDDPSAWNVASAGEALEATIRHWQELASGYRYQGPRRDGVIRSALAIELLSFAPTGGIVAAATSSLPERIGGSRNYDYRYAWIRDASMAVATLAALGDLDSAQRYLSWLARLDSTTEMPVQVVYRVDGGTDVEEHARAELAGYCGSRPVRLGNRAYRQHQLDSLGYVADCALIYLDRGGRWDSEYWGLIRRIADYTAKHWRKPGNGIWERGQQGHFVSSKVMGWTTLARALALADRIGENGNVRQWRRALAEIRAEIMERGWSPSLQSFRQHYDADTVDASTLLIPLMGFLDPTHPRVVGTVQRIEQDLTIEGMVYRFQPEAVDRADDLPMGQFEGAFLPCCFWLAAVYAMMGRRNDAEAVLRRIEPLAGELGLFSEQADPRSRLLLGNLPMIFSHAEYVRAVLQLYDLWPRVV
jgi:GH15 family glucan-1,4-alpha-glucosidase